MGEDDVTPTVLQSGINAATAESLKKRYEGEELKNYWHLIFIYMLEQIPGVDRLMGCRKK